MRQVWGCMVALTFIVAMAAVPIQSVAEETPEQVPTPADPAVIEAAIRQLSEPVDHETLSQIFFDLGQLEDPSEQERLQGLLDERMRELTQIPELPPQESAVVEIAPEDVSGLGPEAFTDEELLMQIEMLHLGPDATVEDLRVRDELVDTIARIPDPIRREALLVRLEEREREAERAASIPVEFAQ